jgi:hypothetical protein
MFCFVARIVDLASQSATTSTEDYMYLWMALHCSRALISVLKFIIVLEFAHLVFSKRVSSSVYAMSILTELR